MQEIQSGVKAFMLAAGQEVADKPKIQTASTRILRVRLLLEEVLEFAKASGVNIRSHTERHELIDDIDHSFSFDDAGEEHVNLVECADGLADISYVNYGAALSYGIDLEPVEKEVQRSNMDKFGEGGYRDSNGKWRKPPNWTPPDIKSTIDAQAA